MLQAAGNTRSAARAFGAKVDALARVHRARLSGFRQAFVGLFVGFFDAPDNNWPFHFNGSDAICRVCRVFSGRESSGEFSERFRTGRLQWYSRGWHPPFLGNGLRSGLQKSLSAEGLPVTL